MHADDTSPGTPERTAAMLDCNAAMRMLWDFLDGHLAAADDTALRAHMDKCSHCFPHAQFGELLLKAVAEQRKAPESTASVRDGVLARLALEGYEAP